MQHHTTQAIILKNLLFQDKKSIVTAYTLEHGLCHFMTKGLSQKKSHLFALTSPLMRVELHYKTSASEWLYLEDGRVLEDYVALKQSWEVFNLAASLCKILNDTLLPRSANMKIFHLLCAFFPHLPHSKNPFGLTTHFLLKLLTFEGILKLSPTCHCGKKAEGLQHGQSFCFSCKDPREPWAFDDEEFQEILTLIALKRYSEFDPFISSEQLFEKTKNYFYKVMDKKI